MSYVTFSLLVCLTTALYRVVFFLICLSNCKWDSWKDFHVEAVLDWTWGEEQEVHGVPVLLATRDKVCQNWYIERKEKCSKSIFSRCPVIHACHRSTFLELLQWSHKTGWRLHMWMESETSVSITFIATFHGNKQGNWRLAQRESSDIRNSYT